MPSAGSRLGPYEILSTIGAGGMGEVYRAHDSRIGREIAIKILPQHLIENSERLRRFEQEARAAGALNHPNILSLYDVGAENGTPYLVTELLEGETLRRKLLDGPITIRKAIDYLVQAFNPAAVDGVMCRNTISIGWYGTLYDCDFNQMLDLPIQGSHHISKFNVEDAHRSPDCYRTPLLRLYRRSRFDLWRLNNVRIFQSIGICFSI